MLKVIAVVLLLAVCITADKPMDLPCVTWVLTNSHTPTDPTDLFLAAQTWVMQDAWGNCILMGDVFPCFASDTGIDTWGHHDYQRSEIPADVCRTYHQGTDYFSENFYLPKKGPQWQTWKWVQAETGGTVPDNAIRFGPSVMARSSVNAPGSCAGRGFTGWAVGEPNGTFGAVHFSVVTTPYTTNSFEVAVCEAWHPTPTPTPSPEPTHTPPPPTPTQNPTLPFIRFGHTIPDAHHLDAVIVQGDRNYTWTNYAFGQFSGWVRQFVEGQGNILLYDNINGTRGKLWLNLSIPLTPGPLVVVAKNMWPPNTTFSVETIAASYVPIESGAAVRLFNLSPDTINAGMKANGAILVDDVPYAQGSYWAFTTASQTNFTAFDDATMAPIATITTTPPPAPMVFTNFLVGLHTEKPSSPFATQLIPLLDAPEF